MNEGAGIPFVVELLTAALLVAGAATTLIGTAGLIRFPDFYQRVHAPTLGTTLGTACVALASILYFSALETRPAVHEILILTFVTVTTPVTLMVLVRAAVFRDEIENDPPVSPAGSEPG